MAPRGSVDALRLALAPRPGRGRRRPVDSCSRREASGCGAHPPDRRGGRGLRRGVGRSALRPRLGELLGGPPGRGGPAAGGGVRRPRTDRGRLRAAPGRGRVRRGDGRCPPGLAPGDPEPVPNGRTGHRRSRRAIVVLGGTPPRAPASRGAGRFEPLLLRRDPPLLLPVLRRRNPRRRRDGSRGVPGSGGLAGRLRLRIGGLRLPVPGAGRGGDSDHPCGPGPRSRRIRLRMAGPDPPQHHGGRAQPHRAPRRGADTARAADPRFAGPRLGSPCGRTGAGTARMGFGKPRRGCGPDPPWTDLHGRRADRPGGVPPPRAAGGDAGPGCCWWGWRCCPSLRSP